VAFWALAEIVRQRLAIAEEDPADVAADKLKEGLERFVPDPVSEPTLGCGWAACSALPSRRTARSR
jgi:hypothetical protein